MIFYIRCNQNARLNSIKKVLQPKLKRKGRGTSDWNGIYYVMEGHNHYRWRNIFITNCR